MREIPVHPILARILAWLEGGGAGMQFFGRAPEPQNLIVPSRKGRCRSANHMLTKVPRRPLADCSSRTKATRSSQKLHLTLSKADGGRRDILRFITHGSRKSDVMDGYTTLPWDTLWRASGKKLEDHSSRSGCAIHGGGDQSSAMAEKSGAEAAKVSLAVTRAVTVAVYSRRRGEPRTRAK